MSVIIKTRIKDRGEITWPPIGETATPDDGTPEARTRRREWLRDRIVEAAEDARVVLGVPATRTVHVSLTFKPDIMVDPA